jgi:hypothetical protein
MRLGQNPIPKQIYLRNVKTKVVVVFILFLVISYWGCKKDRHVQGPDQHYLDSIQHVQDSLYQIHIEDSLDHARFTHFMDNIGGTYLTSGTYSYWNAGVSWSDTVTNDTIYISRVSDSTIHVLALYDSIFHHPQINDDLDYDSAFIATDYYGFQYHATHLTEADFYKDNFDSISLYFHNGGLSLNWTYTLHGRKIQ